MKVLIVDNNDSFTYNLKHYVSQFTEYVDVIRFNRVNLEDVSLYDKILFSPGPGLPNEYPILNHILSKYGHSRSILGICLGQQSIIEFFGGILYNLPVPLHGVTSKVRHLDNCSLYNGIPCVFRAAHYHSWVVSEDNFPKEFEVTSFNQDGLIMSVKHKSYDIKGVQYHPESILAEYGLQLIRNWLTD